MPTARRTMIMMVGLVGFFEHLVRDRKVDEGLIEGKAKRLLMRTFLFFGLFF
jgi:hypothetical protein